MRLLSALLASAALLGSLAGCAPRRMNQTVPGPGPTTVVTPAPAPGPAPVAPAPSGGGRA